MAEAEGTTTEGTQGTQETGQRIPETSQAPPLSTTDPGQPLLRQDSLLDWRNGMAENVRTAPIVARQPTIEALAKVAIEQDKALGRAVFLPTAEPGSDDYLRDMQKVFDKLGRPEKPEVYDLPVPEGKEMDPEIGGRWKQAFYKAGLTTEQAKEMVEEFWRTAQYAENIMAAQAQESNQRGRKALYAQFGATTDLEVQQANEFFSHFGKGAFAGDAAVKAWEAIQEAVLPDGSLLANNPYFIATFAEANRKLGEGEYHESGLYVPGQDTMATMEARMKELTAKKFAGGLTEREHGEIRHISTEIARARERNARGGTARNERGQFVA